MEGYRRLTFMMLDAGNSRTLLDGLSRCILYILGPVMLRWNSLQQHVTVSLGSTSAPRGIGIRLGNVCRCTWSIVFVLLVPRNGYGDDRNQVPKIDMHLHANLPAEYNPYWLPRNLPHPATEAEMIGETVRTLEQFNIVKAVTSGRYERVKRWKAAAPDRIIAALHFAGPENLDQIDTNFLRQEFSSRRLEVFGEVVAQLFGRSPSDSAFEPYFALSEELDVPVAIHTGFPPPGAAYIGLPKLRAALGNPLLLEDALLRHPKMRVYIMHAGYPFLEETIALLHAHPQVYVDLGCIDWVIPKAEFHEYLRRLVQAGFGQRLMFGSDEMGWPAAIGLAVEEIESASFLTAEDKRNVFYNNAARFLKLDGSDGPTSRPGRRHDADPSNRNLNQPRNSH